MTTLQQEQLKTEGRIVGREQREAEKQGQFELKQQKRKEKQLHWICNRKVRKVEMPYITIESGTLSDEQKELLIKRLTEVSSEIMKVPQEFFVTTIKEVSDKNFGIGGKTIDVVKEEYIKKHQ